jgi:hypothetical protein
MPTEESRYQEISRRAFLRRSAAVGLAAAVPSALLAACGSDADVFAGSSTTTSSDDAASATTTVPATTAAAVTTTSTTSTTTTTTPTTSGTTLPDDAEVVVDFTYEASSRGGVKNPYIAVWVEDEAGDLVATVALWFLQSSKGLKWLSDLRRWATVDGSDSTIDAISSATRAPGAYSVVWDGTTTDGERVAQGTYYIAIESAREHGPYSLIREAVSFGEESFEQTLAAEGELSNASVSVVLA